MILQSYWNFPNGLFNYIQACIFSRLKLLFNFYVTRTVHRQDFGAKCNFTYHNGAPVTNILKNPSLYTIFKEPPCQIYCGSKPSGYQILNISYDNFAKFYCYTRLKFRVIAVFITTRNLDNDPESEWLHPKEQNNWLKGQAIKFKRYQK